MILLNGNSTKKYIHSIIYGILLFLYLFEFELLGTTSLLSSRKLAFMLVIFIYILVFLKNKGNSFTESHLKEFSTIFVFLIYILGYLLFLILIYGIVDDSTYIYPRLIYFLLYSILGSLLFSKIFNKVDHFLNGLIIAVFIQSTIVYLQFISPDIRSFFKNTFVEQGNISYLRENRASGLGAEGATLSLLLFSGLFACGYFIIKNQKIIYMLLYIYILISILLVARTGLYIGLINLFIILLLSYKKDKSIKYFMNFGKYLTIIISSLTMLWFILLKYIDEQRINKIFDWTSSLFNDGLNEGSVQAISKMVIPELTIETLFGTGITRGESGLGTIIQHDSGYIQAYFAFGLINSILFYIIIYLLLFILIKKINNKLMKTYLYFYLIILIVVEVKEPFIFKYMLPFILMTITLLYRKNEYRNKYNT